MHYTLRTRNVEQMKKLMMDCDGILSEVCPRHQLLHTAKWFDYFPTVVNDGFCNQIIKEAAKKLNLYTIDKHVPFKFGEDFGWFAQQHKAAMFGIGSGLQCPALHQANYDFPEEIIETGMSMFEEIISSLLKK
jgi:metal-dependent amidase/aminoacylase/carboxypeptidase family protein